MKNEVLHTSKEIKWTVSLLCWLSHLFRLSSTVFSHKLQSLKPEARVLVPEVPACLYYLAEVSFFHVMFEYLSMQALPLVQVKGARVKLMQLTHDQSMVCVINRVLLVVLESRHDFFSHS